MYLSDTSNYVSTQIIHITSPTTNNEESIQTKAATFEEKAMECLKPNRQRNDAAKLQQNTPSKPCPMPPPCTKPIYITNGEVAQARAIGSGNLRILKGYKNEYKKCVREFDKKHRSKLDKSPTSPVFIRRKHNVIPQKEGARIVYPKEAYFQKPDVHNMSNLNSPIIQLNPMQRPTYLQSLQNQQTYTNTMQNQTYIQSPYQEIHHYPGTRHPLSPPNFLTSPHTVQSSLVYPELLIPHTENLVVQYPLQGNNPILPLPKVTRTACTQTTHRHVVTQHQNAAPKGQYKQKKIVAPWLRAGPRQPTWAMRIVSAENAEKQGQKAQNKGHISASLKRTDIQFPKLTQKQTSQFGTSGPGRSILGASKQTPQFDTTGPGKGMLGASKPHKNQIQKTHPVKTGNMANAGQAKKQEIRNQNKRKFVKICTPAVSEEFSTVVIFCQKLYIALYDTMHQVMSILCGKNGMWKNVDQITLPELPKRNALKKRAHRKHKHDSLQLSMDTYRDFIHTFESRSADDMSLESGVGWILWDSTVNFLETFSKLAEKKATEFLKKFPDSITSSTRRNSKRIKLYNISASEEFKHEDNIEAYGKLIGWLYVEYKLLDEDVHVGKQLINEKNIIFRQFISSRQLILQWIIDLLEKRKVLVKLIDGERNGFFSLTKRKIIPERKVIEQAKWVKQRSARAMEGWSNRRCILSDSETSAEEVDIV